MRALAAARALPQPRTARRPERDDLADLRQTALEALAEAYRDEHPELEVIPLAEDDELPAGAHELPAVVGEDLEAGVDGLEPRPRLRRVNDDSGED